MRRATVRALLHGVLVGHDIALVYAV
jgi:hypothetical protein